MKLVKYRIVRDCWLGYEVQVWKLWFPFWVQLDFSNTFSSIEKAEAYVKKRNEVKYL